VSEIRNAAGERLDFSLHETGSDELIVIGHGVTANKDREWAVTLATGLENAGLSSLRFSFSGNGDSEGRFEDSTVSKEVRDLGAVLDAHANRRLSYVGHSMGAAVGVLRASSDERLERLVSLSGMVDVQDFARRKFGELVPGRDLMWDKPECPLSQAYMDDVAAIGSVAEQAARIRIPWLLVHGTADTVVLPRDSELAKQRAPHAELLSLPNADHVFSGDAAPAMARLVVNWLV
jgi:pimeloyl-ACP methyl ester carboxylesterase